MASQLQLERDCFPVMQGAAQQATLDVEAALGQPSAPAAVREDISRAAPQTPEAVAAAEAAALAPQVQSHLVALWLAVGSKD